MGLLETPAVLAARDPRRGERPSGGGQGGGAVHPCADHAEARTPPDRGDAGHRPSGLPVEVADLSALHHLPEGAPFWVGPTVNVYNEGTLDWLARRGATRICLPPELPLASVAKLAAAGRAAGVAVEVWGHGRAPLAISGRCYHARLHDRAKDSCQFVCGEDPDGRTIETLDGRSFLTVNGVQTLGHAHTTVAGQVAALEAAGVASIRLSPQTGDFAALTGFYADLLAAPRPGAQEALRRLLPGAELAQGFLDGRAGVAGA